MIPEAEVEVEVDLVFSCVHGRFTWRALQRRMAGLVAMIDAVRSGEIAPTATAHMEHNVGSE